MKKTFYLMPFIGGMCCLLFLSQCTDVLIDDLTDEKINILGPVDQLESANTNQTFWWEALDKKVDSYQIQIVSPSFAAPERLVLQEDIIDVNSFQTQLLPGLYEWSIVAMNEGSSSAATIAGLTIIQDATVDLSNQQVNLVAPFENEQLNDEAVYFLWSAIAGADYYRLQIARPNFENSTFILYDESLAADSFTANLTEGNYQWRVRGENNSSISPYTIGNIIIDLTPPSAPQLLSPITGDSIEINQLLTWSNDDELAYDSLYLYLGNTQTIVETAEVEGSIGSYSLPQDLAGDQLYSWQVKSFDAAGNASEFSSIFSFILKP